MNVLHAPMKTAALTLRLRPRHQRLIRQAAELAEETTSEWARGVLMRAAQRQIRQAERQEE
ncbi:MAG TPA: hypothetical protein DCP69_04390 [Candidatus Omnitrophica bacterium]|nr:hypothetical protein [Candidatus Omnitrophota bacterium]